MTIAAPGERDPHSSRARLVRLAKGGTPTILSSAVTALVPLSGAFVLSTNDYAVWALASTLSTVFVVLDFGSTALATKLAAERRLDPRTTVTLLGITATPPALLGAAVILIWPWYSTAANLVDASGPPAYLLLVLVAIGTLLRSIGMVYSAAALGRERYGHRTAIVLAGALTQLAVTVVTLATGAGYLALGYGILLGGALQMVTGLALERRMDHSGAPAAEATALIRTFVTAKGTGTLLGLVSTQLDRWALGLAATPTLLASYDLAARIATIPKIALIAFAAGLVSEGTKSIDLADALRFLRQSERLTILCFAAASVGTAVFSTVFLLYKGIPPTMIAGVVLAVTLAHGVHSATLPGGHILTGRGRPDLELQYLWPLAGLCTAFYAAGIITQDGVLLITGWAASMVACSIFFVIRAPVFFRRVWAPAT